MGAEADNPVRRRGGGFAVAALGVMNMNCPECGSSNVQKSSAVYEQGVRIGEGRSSGAFVTSRGTVGIGASRSASRSSSLAAELNAPGTGLPLRSMIAGAACFAFGFFGLVVLESFLFFMLAFAAAIPVGIYFLAPTDAEIAERRRYDAQWYCRKCGTIFHDFGKVMNSRQQLSAGNEHLDSSIYRRTTNPREAYIQRATSPVQRASGATERDLAGLARIRSDAQEDGSFSPELLGYDLGLISRLASLNLVRFDAEQDRFFVDGVGPTAPRGWWQRTFGH